MNQKELMIRVLATMRTDLAVKEFELDGIVARLAIIDDYELSHWVDRAGTDLCSAREYLDEIIDRLNNLQ